MDVPIIMLTAKDSEIDKILGLEIEQMTISQNLLVHELQRESKRFYEGFMNQSQKALPL